MKRTKGYSALQIGLHWAIAVLVGVNYISGEAMAEAFDHMLEGEGGAVGLAAQSHVYVGVAILGLVALRLLVRLWRGVPAPDSATPRRLAVVGELAHIGLYGLLALVPVLGLIAWNKGIETIGDLHVLVMNGLMILAGLHAAAALFHHYVMKDGLMRRMTRAE